MCNELDRIAFCIWRIIDSLLFPTSSYILLYLFRTASKDIHDDVILIDLVLRMLVRQLLLYFVVFSKSLDPSSHGQLISITLTCLLFLSMIVASILLAFTWTMVLTCENHGSTLAMRSKYQRSSKNKILKVLLCLCRYSESVPMHYSQVADVLHIPKGILA